MNKRFIKPPEVTLSLIEDLKAGRTDFISGQWLYSKKYKKKVKYVGTFQVPENGIVKPIVVFSYPKEKEDVIGWNNRFLTERSLYQTREKYAANRYPNIKPLDANYLKRNNKPTVTPDKIDTPETTKTPQPFSQKLISGVKKLWSTLKSL